MRNLQLQGTWAKKQESHQSSDMMYTRVLLIYAK